jgi:signal transduction histidine kinase
MGEVATDITELERLVEDVLTTARFELADGGDRGLPPLRTEDVGSDEIVREAATRFSTAHPHRKLVIAVLAQAPVLTADRVLLRRAVDNLLDNAAKYSEPETSVELSLATEGDNVVFTVRDHGAGIPESDMEKLFTPFFRGDRSRSRVTGGFGLGLALARRIVEAHRGTLTARSKQNEGTVFSLTVPARGA